MQMYSKLNDINNSNICKGVKTFFFSEVTCGDPYS